MFNFHLLKQSEFFNIVDNGGDHPLFSLLAEKANTNDVFMDGLMDGYADYYDATIPRPDFCGQGLYLFLKGIFMEDVSDGVKGAAFLDYWKTGYVAGWMLALGENKEELFFLGRPRAHRSQWTRLRSEHEGVDIMGREEYRDRHIVMYVLDDGTGLYIAEVTEHGIISTCECTTEDCKHVRLVKRVSGWFNDEEIVRTKAKAGA